MRIYPHKTLYGLGKLPTVGVFTACSCVVRQIDRVTWLTTGAHAACIGTVSGKQFATVHLYICQKPFVATNQRAAMHIKNQGRPSLSQIVLFLKSIETRAWPIDWHTQDI